MSVCTGTLVLDLNRLQRKGFCVAEVWARTIVWPLAQQLCNLFADDGGRRLNGIFVWRACLGRNTRTRNAKLVKPLCAYDGMTQRTSVGVTFDSRVWPLLSQRPLLS